MHAYGYNTALFGCVNDRESMRIVYNNSSDNSTLGSLEYTDIPVTLLPNLHGKKHPVFSQHHFAGESNLHWEVVNITQSQSEITVDLSASPQKHNNFGYYSTVSRQLKPSTRLLKPWTIVRVDFSHHSECHQLGKSPQPNHEYLASRLPGELHKLRPCIVLKKDGDTTQIIPLSTKTYNEKVASSIALSKLSFNKLPKNMRDDTSYALLHMISTVSSYRIYPLDGADGHTLDYNKQQELCSSDIQAIETGLAQRFSSKIKQHLASKDQQLESKSAEIKGLKARQYTDNQRYQEQLAELDKREQFIRLLGDEMDVHHDDLDMVMSELKASLTT